MLSCFAVANYFLTQQDDDAGDYISNLKLQKLMYYAQGFYLALHGEPLFAESIEAWKHGPVIPGLYHKYKEYGSDFIPADPDFEIDSIPKKVRDHLDEVYSVFGQFSAWKLRNMTHGEAPWINNERFSTVISHKEMEEYFKTLLN